MRGEEALKVRAGPRQARDWSCPLSRPVYATELSRHSSGQQRGQRGYLLGPCPAHKEAAPSCSWGLSQGPRQEEQAGI